MPVQLPSSCQFLPVPPTYFPFRIQPFPSIILNAQQVWLSYVACLHTASQLSHAVEMSIREIDVVYSCASNGHIQHGFGFHQRRCQGFFTEDVLAMSKSSYRLVSMEDIRGDYCHGFDVGSCTELAVIRIDVRDIELIGYLSCAVSVPTADSEDFGS